MRVVKGHVVPVRSLTLKELIAEVNKKKKFGVLESLESSLTEDHYVALEVDNSLLSLLLTSILEDVIKSTLEMSKVIENIDALKVFNDLLVYALKYSFVQPLLKVEDGGKVKAIPASHDVFYAFYMADVEPTIGNLIKFMEALRDEYWGASTSDYGEVKKVLDVYMKLMKLKDSVGAMAELLVYLAPADTRPGLNISSLPSHLLMTSALVIAFGGDERARACALLHDIGKVSKPEQHAKEGANMIEDLFGKHNLKDLSEILGNVKSCVEKHHSLETDQMTSLVKKADVLASSSDRLRVLYECMKKELIDVLGEGYDKIKETFEGADYQRRMESYDWINKNADLVRRATEKIARSVALPTAELIEKVKRGSQKKNVVRDGNAWVIIVDIGGVQKTLSEARKLRVLSGMSYLIDLITNVIVPWNIVKKFDVRPENIVYSGGGTVQAIVPQEGELEGAKLAKKEY